jgi:nucleoside-diphosphate-sugar epimerase
MNGIDAGSISRNQGPQPRVLVLGGTGRTGGRVVANLMQRDVQVVAVVRSPDRLPAGVVGHDLLTVVQADPLAMPLNQLAGHLAGCGAVISCLGHTISAKGVLGPPHDLVEQAIRRVRAAVIAANPAQPVRLVLMSSVSVNQPDGADTRRGRGELACLWLLRGLMPPARDNQRAADFLAQEVGPADPHLEWVVVRPDTLREGEAGPYQVNGELVASLFRPDSTRMAQVADFMGELVTDESLWQTWRGRMPVITDSNPQAHR